MRSATAVPSTPRARRIELVAAIAAAWVLVLARSWVYLAYPHASFDSDQAVVGLMAKHLSEGRAFPLYLYGYNYMLAVEAWIAVPYFWIAGPTVPALRASIVGTNLAVVTLLIVGLQRWGGLRPLGGLLAATFFAFAPPDTTANLIDAGGGNIEPFLWVLALWFVRARPVWFGALLGAGVLNREFTAYAVPVLLAGQVWSGAVRKRETWRGWLVSAAAFAVVWLAVLAGRPLADLAGPGTRGRDVGWQTSTVDNISHRIRIDIAAMPGGAWTLLARDVPALVGGRPIETNLARQGRHWVRWMLAVAAVAFVARLAWLGVGRRVSLNRAAMGWYVLGVGLMAVIGYALTRPVDVVTGRYLLLAIFLPVGAAAVWLALEPSHHVRHAVAAVVMAWAVASGVDNWRQYARYASGQIPDPMLEIIAALDARGVAVAKAQYWRAYKLTFMTQERIKVASSDIVRIEEYQRLAEHEGERLVRLERQPCPGGTFVGGLYICQ
jgi:hypothetical protein